MCIFYYLIIISLDSSLGVSGVCVWTSLVILKHSKQNVSYRLWIGYQEQNTLHKNFLGGIQFGRKEERLSGS